MERPSCDHYTCFWLSPLNMIHLFLLIIVPNSLRSAIHKFISESNSLFKSLIPLSNTTCTMINHPIPILDDDDDDDDDCVDDGHHVAMLMEKMGLPCELEGEDHMMMMMMKMGSAGEVISGIFEEGEPSIEELRAAFDVFDCNRDGFIDAFELQRVIQILGMGKGCDLEACGRMITTFDLNGDARIDIDEFFRFMTKNLC